jgi:hypothetical protein
LEWKNIFLCIWIVKQCDSGSIVPANSDSRWELRDGHKVLSEHQLGRLVVRLPRESNSESKRLRLCVEARLDDFALHVESLVATERAATQVIVGSANHIVD